MIKNTIPVQEPSKVGNAGARPIPGKTNESDSVIKDAAVLKSNPEPVREAQEVAGKASECIRQQVGQNGNGKHRDSAEWGIGAKSDADADALKK